MSSAEASIRFCPACGAPLAPRWVAGRERLACERCDFVYYLNPKVAAGVIVEKDGRVVLIRRGIEPKKGFWALPSGFVELDESAEEAAARECLEETGLLVAVEELLGVYSFQSLVYGRGVLILYSARVTGGELRAGDDASDVAAFLPADVPPDVAFRSHREALRDWRRAKAVSYRPATLEEAGASRPTTGISSPREPRPVRRGAGFHPIGRSGRRPARRLDGSPIPGGPPLGRVGPDLRGASDAAVGHRDRPDSSGDRLGPRARAGDPRQGGIRRQSGNGGLPQNGLQGGRLQ